MDHNSNKSQDADRNQPQESPCESFWLSDTHISNTPVTLNFFDPTVAQWSWISAGMNINNGHVVFNFVGVPEHPRDIDCPNIYNSKVTINFYLTPDSPNKEPPVPPPILQNEVKINVITFQGSSLAGQTEPASHP